MSRYIYILTLLSLLTACSVSKIEDNFSKEIKFTVSQFENVLALGLEPNQIPRTIDKNNKLTTVGVYNWTSGFYAGNLWYLYELTKDNKWKNEASKWTEALDTIQYWTGNHDVGFIIYNSYGNAYRFDDRIDYKDIIVNTAESLSQRYNPKVGLIKSWDYRKAWDGKTEWFYPVIIDNMMNLELLFEASILSGNQKYKEIAIKHANETMKNHYRDDYSCYHVVDYDKNTGEILDKATCQGYSDNSSWARGQAWGLYGYAMCYRYTKDKKYLDFAENIADFILNNKSTPEDLIPFWDYNVNQTSFTPEWNYNPTSYTEIPRDVSAASITASALFELSEYAQNSDLYLNAAIKILKNLSGNYLADPTKNKYFILGQSVGSFPHGVEINVPLVYADYYYLEAIYRYNQRLNELAGF